MERLFVDRISANETLFLLAVVIAVMVVIVFLFCRWLSSGKENKWYTCPKCHSQVNFLSWGICQECKL